MSASHCRLWYHLVFASRERRAWLEHDLRSEMIPYLGGTACNLGATLCAAGGWPDHRHLLVQVPAEIAISALVRGLKASSSRWVHQRFESNAEFAWQEEFSAFTVSHSQVPMVRRYLDGQEQHHADRPFDQEYRRLLQVHALEDRSD
ncbi:MAG: IS200/IS605 family transposase [Bryobacterales bacterium]|nr:IS200/IS605 family transposase [Bryobacterales bacterium]